MSRISGEPQAVSGIGRALPDPIHWPTRGFALERENNLFGQVIPVRINCPKFISTIGSMITQINGVLVIVTKGRSERIIGWIQ